MAALGKALIKDRFKGRRALHERGGMSLNHTSDLDDGSMHSRITDSITDQSNLDDFLSTAELAGTAFAAERMNVSMLTEYDNEALMTSSAKQKLQGTHHQKRNELRVPRRPKWTRTMTAEVLEQLEKESFLDWRRGLAKLQDDEGLLLTPFERNIELWRQLWRVVERSDVVVQIVDARNPLLFRCPDLERYVGEVDPNKSCVLLLNKADLLPQELREEWATYFDKIGVDVVFFSAAEEQLRLVPGWTMPVDEFDDHTPAVAPPTSSVPATVQEEANEEEATEKAKSQQEQPKQEQEQPSQPTQPTTTDPVAVPAESVEKLTLTDTTAPSTSTTQAPSSTNATDVAVTDAAVTGAGAGAGVDASAPKKHRNSPAVLACDDLFTLLLSRCKEGRTIGLVGYPNVGKSSTINALCHSKKVSVSATPGKTKHFQTIEFGDCVLCDCPGLVFPNFVCTRAEMVCNGILPIDQLRDVIAPVTHVCLTISRATLEQRYNIKIIAPSAEDPDQTRPPTARELLNAYSVMRGFMAARGTPDISRGARYILKDFVNGKLLHCEHPPVTPGAVGPSSTAVQLAAALAAADRRDRDGGAPRGKTEYANEVDEEFFSEKTSQVKTRGAQTKQSSGKKHFNKNRREKLRRMFPTA